VTILCLVERHKQKAKSDDTFLLSESEVVTGGVLHPGVVLRTINASMKTNCFSWKFSGGKRTGIGKGTGRLTLDITLFFPGGEVVDTTDFSGGLNPLKDLGHRDEVNIVLVEQLVDPLQESVEVLGVELKPRGVEVESKRSSVGLVMSLEIVVEEVVELFPGNDVGTGVNHCASGKFFVERGVITTIEFVHDHFPDGVRSRGTVLSVTVTSVWHTEVESVWPKWGVREWGSDGGIVEEGLLFHHEELGVASNSEVGSADTNNGVVSNVSKTFHDQTNTSHFLCPCFCGGLGPILLIVLVGD